MSKQVLAGSGNVFYRQDKNAGSVNNQNAVNNQAANSLKSGPGFGNAAIAQQNSQTQTASTNPVTPTVQINSPSSTNSFTGSDAGILGALPAVLAVNDLNLAGGGGGLFRQSGGGGGSGGGSGSGSGNALINLVLPVVRGAEPAPGKMCESQLGGKCAGGMVASSRASGGVLMPL